MKKIKVIFLVFIAISMVVGCDESKNIVEQQVANFFEGYKKRDASISELLVGGTETDNMKFEGISTYFAEELKYEIKSCKKQDDNTYNVKVKVQTIDFEQLFLLSYQETIEGYGEEGISEHFMDEMEQNIKENNWVIKEVTCNVVVRKINDTFKIQMDSSLANALSGGMNEYLNSLQGGE